MSVHVYILMSVHVPRHMSAHMSVHGMQAHRDTFEFQILDRAIAKYRGPSHN